MMSSAFIICTKNKTDMEWKYRCCTSSYVMNLALHHRD